MFQPLYVTRAVQQAYGIEHPIGDPFGGAAYGEKNGGGSFGKALGGVASILGGAALIVATGGAAAPLGAMLIGGAMIAGGAMTSIGAISGNQTLTKIGGITSAVAGVAALGYGAVQNWDSISNFLAEGTAVAGETGATAGAATAAGEVGGAAAAADTGTMTSIPGVGWNAEAAQGASTAGQMSMANTPGAFDAQSVSGAFGNAALPTAAAAPIDTSATANAINSTGFGSVGLPTANAAPLAGSAAPFGSTGGATVGDTGGFITGVVPGAEESPGLLSSVGNFIQKNPVASMMGLQAVGGMMEGASPKSQAEGEYLQAMAATKQAEADYIQAQQDYLANAKTDETKANTTYLEQKAAEWDKTKQYEEEKRAAYNASIAALQTPQTQNLAQTMYGGAQTGIINQARA